MHEQQYPRGFQPGYSEWSKDCDKTMTEMISGIVGEFPGSLAEGPEKTKPEEAFMKISLGVSCTLQSRGKQISAIEIYERLLRFLY